MTTRPSPAVGPPIEGGQGSARVTGRRAGSSGLWTQQASPPVQVRPEQLVEAGDQVGRLAAPSCAARWTCDVCRARCQLSVRAREGQHRGRSSAPGQVQHDLCPVQRGASPGPLCQGALDGAPQPGPPELVDAAASTRLRQGPPELDAEPWCSGGLPTGSANAFPFHRSQEAAPRTRRPHTIPVLPG